MNLKNIFILVLGFSALFISGCAHIQSRQDVLLEAEKIKTISLKQNIEEPKPVSVQTLPEFEELTYKARYLGMTVGTMTASIKGIEKINGRDCYKFELAAKTEGMISKMFKAEDRYVSYMDVEKKYVVRHEEFRHEGKYRKEAIVDFDQVNHKAHFKNMSDGSEKTIDIPADVQDALTANYYFRMIPWGLGDTVNLKVYVEEKVYDIIGLVKSKIKLSLHKFGKQEAYTFEPYALLAGERVQKGRVVGFFASSNLRPPLRGDINTPLFGRAYIYLSEASYPKHYPQVAESRPDAFLLR